jgi:hypothetical protein
MSGDTRCSADTREAVAFELWQRFAPVHHIGWADETHKAEYYAAADGVLAVLPAPAQSVGMREALEPFAKLAELAHTGHRDSRPVIYGFATSKAERLTIGDLRRAAAALATAAPVGPMPHMCAPCADCGKREPCDGDCPNHLPRCSAGNVPARETVARILAHKMPSLRMANDTPGNYAHSIADEIVAALTNEPQGVCMCSPLTRYTDAPHDDTCPLSRPQRVSQ